MPALKTIAERALAEAQSLKVDRPTSFVVIAFNPMTWEVEIASPINLPPAVNLLLKSLKGFLKKQRSRAEPEV